MSISRYRGTLKAIITAIISLFSIFNCHTLVLQVKYEHTPVNHKHKPLISFIIPSTLARNDLNRTIESLQRLRELNWEAIIGVDVRKSIYNSTDHIHKRRRYFSQDRRLQWVPIDVNDTDRGASSSIYTITMKTAIVASLIASAAAFAPAKDAAGSSALKAMPFESEIGAQEPIGFFDPLGMIADGDQARFDRLRYTEVKHGRIAMLAVVGYLATDGGARLEGLISYDGTKFADIPSGFDAILAMPSAGLAQIIFFIGFLEAAVMKDSANGAAPGDFPGDFRNGALDFGWDSFDEETKISKRAIELNNGRAAQMGILGLMVHEKLGVSVLPEGAVQDRKSVV